MRMLVFQSDLFRPYLPDAAQVNPNVLGFELAYWLSRELAADGLTTSYPNAEDWGWYLDLLEGDVEYMICCSGGLEDGDVHEWQVYVIQPKKLFRGGGGEGPAGPAIVDRIRRVLGRAGIDVNEESDAH